MPIVPEGLDLIIKIIIIIIIIIKPQAAQVTLSYTYPKTGRRNFKTFKMAPVFEHITYGRFYILNDT